MPRVADEAEEQRTGGIVQAGWGAALALIAAGAVFARLLSVEGGEAGSTNRVAPRLENSTAGEHIELVGDAREQRTPRSIVAAHGTGDQQPAMGEMAELYWERRAHAESTAELERRLGGMAELYREQQLARKTGSVDREP